MAGSYWMGGNRREGEGRGSGWQLLDGRQEGGGGGGEVVDSYWMGGSRREGEGRGGEVVGSYWMGGSRREGEGKFALTHTNIQTDTHTHLSLAVQ